MIRSSAVSAVLLVLCMFACNSSSDSSTAPGGPGGTGSGGDGGPGGDGSPGTNPGRGDAGAGSRDGGVKGGGDDSGTGADAGAASCPSTPTGTTYYVASTGSDSADGSSGQPVKTITKALSLAGPGDRVLVAAGTYQEVVTFPKSGTDGKPIILQGSGAVIVDGGDRVTGWVAASEVGANVYKNTSFSHAPANMTWNGKYVAVIEPSQKAQDEAFNILNQGPEGWDTYDGTTYRSWDGVEAMFGTFGGATYVRFAANNDPNKEDLAFAPEGRGVLNASGQSHITICGLTLQNGYHGVMIDKSDHVIVHGNTIIGGHAGVEITNGSSSNEVSNNELTLNYVHSLDPNDPRHWFIWAVFKLTSDWDRVGVELSDAGNDNVVSGNHIYQHWDGVQDFGKSDACQNLKVFGNHIEHSADDGLEPTGGEINAEWHDNLVHDCNIDFRIKSPTAGPLYIYRNRLATPSTDDKHGENVAFYTYTGTTTPMFIYHNSISSYLANYFGNNASIGAPNTWWVNNVISSGKFGDFTGGGPVPHFDYNWAGGDASKQSFMGSNDIIDSGKRMWADGDLDMKPSAAVQGKGLDLSKTWSFGGASNPALPGMTAGYFSGSAPNMGYAP